MELKNIIPNVKETFGNLEYAGEGEPITEYDQKARRSKTVARRFNLFSDVQKADHITVIIPANAGPKEFEFMESVALIDPIINVKGYIVNGRAFREYVLNATDLVSLENKKAIRKEGK